MPRFIAKAQSNKNEIPTRATPGAPKVLSQNGYGTFDYRLPSDIAHVCRGTTESYSRYVAPRATPGLLDLFLIVEPRATFRDLLPVCCREPVPVC